MTVSPDGVVLDAVERWSAHLAACRRCANGTQADCEIGERLWLAAAEARGRWLLRRAHTAAVRIAVGPPAVLTNEPAPRSKKRTG
jgi:hypothetical protein